MMPGETHPAAPGPADLARCQGCASLQQNLNEYVEALIALKQKIINTDNLLTEYQKKCDELQFARRENSTLHHQVEQMLQKISPLQKCQEELGSLKAELEEKKSSLKLYQDTHQEYARVKEECLRTDAQKKKLEAKVKKLEEAAVKQTQDFKQLRNEKKILEKEFKKTQERLDEFSKQKNDKELRHIGTQISSDSHGSIDKRKVKVLLKELWLCVNTAHRLSGESGRRIPDKPAKGNSAPRASEQDELLPGQGSPAGAADMRSFFTKLSMEMEGDFSSSESAEEELPSGTSPSTEHFREERHPEVTGQRPDDRNRSNVYDHEHFFDDDLQAAIDFFKLPPPLLSPVPSPPPTASGSLPSSLAPESFFGEFTDSSDSDSVPPRDSMDSALEDFTAESRGYFALLEKIRRSNICMEKPGLLGSAQAVNKLTPPGFVTGRTALGEPSATPPLARGRPWTASSEFVRDRGEAVEDAERKVEAREVDKSVQVGKGLRKRNRRPWLETASRGPARKKEAGAGESEIRFSPLGKRTFSELIESEGKTLSSKALCPSQSEFSKRTLTDGFASKTYCVTGSGHFQRRERDVQESTPQSGICAAAAGHDRPASLPSSSSATSVPVSVCSNLQASWRGCVTVGSPAEVTCTEQKSPTRTLNTFLLRSEPTACFPKENDPENSLSTSSPKSKLGISTFSDWKSRGLESFSTLKSTVKGHSLPQSVFQKPTVGGQCGGRGPGTTFILPKSDWTSLARSQAGFTRRSPGSADSTSWHRSEVLRRGSGGSPRATSEYQQKLPLEKVAPTSQNSRLSAMLGPPGESTTPLELKAAASLLPNQVSVITKQARPKRVLSSSLEPWRPHGSTLSPAVNGGKDIGLRPSVPACVGDGDPIAQVPEQVADEEIPSPEVSVSWRKPICDSPSDSLLAESVGSTDCKSPFSSEDNIFQCVMNEHLLEKARKSPQTTQSGASRLEAGELLPSGVASGVFPPEQMPRGPHHQANTEALVTARDFHNAPQNASAPPIAPSRGPLKARVPTGPVCPSSPAEEETQGTSQSSLPGASYCYTGVRERGGEDTEVEDEPVSCSEGEHEAEAVMGRRQQDAAGDSHRPLGDQEDGVGEAGHPSDVGDLTSAFQECNLSTFLYIDKLSTSEVVMVLESCQLRDYSSRASVSECSSKVTLNEEMNKELRQSEISRKKCGKRFCEEELLRASEEWAESEGDDSCGKKSCHTAQCPLEVSSDVLTKTGEELHTNPVDCGGKDTEHALLVNTHHSQAAEDLTENILREETSSPMPHTDELPEPSAMDGGGSSPLSSRSDPEHSQSRYEDEPDSGEFLSTGEEGLGEPGELLTLSSDSLAPPRLEQSSDCVTETAFRYQISAVTSEVISVLINKDQDLVIEKGDNWTIISGVAISPGMEQVVLCDTLGDAAPSQDQGGLEDGSMEKSPEASPSGPLPQESACVDLSGAQEDVSSSGQSANFDKSRLRNRPVKPSIWIRSQIYDQTLETEKVTSDHTYYNWKLEPLGKNKPRSKISNKDQASKLAKIPVVNRGEVHLNEVPQPVSEERTNIKTPRSQAQPTTAGTDVTTPTKCSPDTLSKIRQEVGPPLPPLLPPLIATPPRTSRTLSPRIPSSSPSSRSSPAGHVSPLCEVPGPPVLSPWPEELQQASPLDPSPSPSTATASGRIVSSPLQFCAATPKHALPVPGRLPSCAPGHAAVSGPQENSVKILDTMYPELSARARTLSLLKGNMQLSRGSTVDGKVLPGRVSALLGLKAITSTSTAFVLTGGSSGGDGGQGKSQDSGVQQDAGGKRTLAVSMPRSAKRLRLDNESPQPDTSEVTGEGVPEDPPGGSPPAEVVPAEEEQADVPGCSSVSLLRVNPRQMAESYNIAITRALRKIAESSFDLLPVIRSHVYVGNISKKPVMRDQEKEVVYEFSTTNKHLGEYLLRSILSELKIQKTSLDHSYIHALCRVYVGICRQLGDLERARLFCYSLLKEDFPESEKLTLFIANMWREVFLSQSAISEAMQLVARQRARGEVLNCLRAFLSWEKNAPIDVGIVVSKLLLTIQLCPKTEFQSSEEFGEDLSANIWEYIFAIDLLCCHQRWIWTHDNIISKELWPVMDKWIKYRKGHSNIAYTPDVIVASVLRLIGRLGQLGLKEGFPTAVKNISSVIGMFIQHAQDEDIPWGVQLAAVYALCDLSPSNPAEISKILEAWRTQTSNTIPSAIVSCLEEVGSLSADGSAGSTSKGDCVP